jgi:hypothetical protein
MAMRVVLPILFSFLWIAPAAAYVGPGLGLGAIAVVLGIVGSVLLALFAIIFYPIKRALRRKRQRDAGGPNLDQ